MTRSVCKLFRIDVSNFKKRFFKRIFITRLRNNNFFCKARNYLAFLNSLWSRKRKALHGRRNKPETSCPGNANRKSNRFMYCRVVTIILQEGRVILIILLLTDRGYGNFHVLQKQSVCDCRGRASRQAASTDST